MKKLLLAVLLTFGLATLAYSAPTVFTDLKVTGNLEVVTSVTPPATGAAIPLVDVTVTSPTVAGVLVRTSAYVVYISTNTTNLLGWVKVGGQ
jgi:hypothetical protein